MKYKRHETTLHLCLSPEALNKINKWQVFWLNVYFDLPIRIFANSGVREVTLLLKKIKGPFYSYGDSSGF